MDLNRLVLGSAGLGVGAVGATYLVSPATFLDVYGVGIQSASEANLFRSGSGGLFLAFALVFCVGAIKPDVARSAQISLLAFMGGAAVGRLVSMVFDGRPHDMLVSVFVVEVVYAFAAALLLRNGAVQEEPSPARVTSV